MNTVWVVGNVIAETANGRYAWLCEGVYSTKETAEMLCLTDHHFVGPITLDEPAPDGEVPWVGAYYPLRDPMYLKRHG